MSIFKRTLVAGALALGLATPAAAQFSNVYVLGDSLVDAGFYGPRFTINPGLVWPQDLASVYGINLTSVATGGTDLAQGGARVTQPSSATPAGAPQRPVSTQIDQLLQASPTLDPNALYIVWVGGNDLLQNLQDAQAGTISLGQVQTNLSVAGTQVAQQVARLQAAGARYIVLMNLPDAGSSPRGIALGPAVPFTAMSQLLNSAQNAAVGQLGLNVIAVNTAGFIREITANPSLYGFTNVTTPACTVAAERCTAATLRVTPAVAETYLYADDVHPTPAGHRIIAQYVGSVLAAPSQTSALAESPLAVESASFRALDSRMMSATNAPGRGNKAEAWASYDYGNPDINTGYASGDQKLNTATAGIDFKLSQRLLVGMAIGYTENKVDLGLSGFKLKETTGTVYAGYGEGPWYVGGTVGASDLDYGDVHRDIPLGATVRTESGNTKGYATTARALAGYWFNTGGNFIHGPIARVTWQDIKVRGYSEQGSASTTMSFDEQRRKSLISSLGWQAEGTFGMFRPFARAEWQYEAKADARNVGASVYGMNGHFSLPTGEPDDNWGLFTLGAAADFGRVTGYLYGQGTSGKSDGNGYGINVGIRVPL